MTALQQLFGEKFRSAIRGSREGIAVDGRFSPQYRFKNLGVTKNFGTSWNILSTGKTSWGDKTFLKHLEH
jgi:hypothetical protein